MKNHLFAYELENYIIYSDGKIWSKRKSKFIKPHTTGAGYKQVEIDGIPFYVHRLVGTYFIENIERKPQINHIDGFPSNNDVSNLEWCTQSENNTHANKTGLRKKKLRKLTDVDVLKAKELSKTGLSQAKIGRVFNVTHSTIGRIFRGETYV